MSCTGYGATLSFGAVTLPAKIRSIGGVNQSVEILEIEDINQPDHLVEYCSGDLIAREPIEVEFIHNPEEVPPAVRATDTLILTLGKSKEDAVAPANYTGEAILSAYNGPPLNARELRVGTMQFQVTGQFAYTPEQPGP